MSKKGRVVALAVDAFDHRLVQAGIDEGWMPATAELIERGRCAMLSNSDPAFVSVWPPTITGVRPRDQLLIFNRQLKPSSHVIHHVTGDALRFPPFWSLLSAAGVRSTVVSVFAQPLIEGFLGTQVVGWGSRDPMTAKFLAPKSDPPEVLEWLEREIPARRLGLPKRIPRNRQDMERLRDESVVEVHKQTRAISMLMERTEWDFFMSSFTEPHAAGHFLWNMGSATNEDDGLPASVHEGIGPIYRAVDDGLGRLAEQLPSDATLFVFSPHGMAPAWQTLVTAEPLLERAGWLVRRPSGPVDTRIRSIAAIRSVIHRTLPFSVRLALGDLVYEKRTQFLAEAELADIDWARTQAFVLPGDETTFIRVNLAGREPKGIVGPGDEYDNLCDQIAEEFGSIEDEKGAPAVVRVSKSIEELGRTPGDVLPDITVEWSRKPMGLLHSPRLGNFDVPPTPLRAAHLPEGFLIGAGPSIEPSGSKRLKGPKVTNLDLAPTVLARFDVPPPEILAGSPIGEFSGNGR